jgi:hypothetical protein
MIRASKIEHDSWASLNPGSASTWGWDAIFPYMKSAPLPQHAGTSSVDASSLQSRKLLLHLHLRMLSSQAL